MKLELVHIAMGVTREIITKFCDELDEVDLKSSGAFIIFLNHFAFLLVIRRAQAGKSIDAKKSLKIMSKELKDFYPQLSKRQRDDVFYGDHIRINEQYFNDDYKKLMSGDSQPFVNKLLNDFVSEPMFTDTVLFTNVLLQMIMIIDSIVE